jgi:predicted GNAT family N-acyltransferase
MIAGYLWVTQPEELKQCFAVRQSVFVEEQGFQNEFDEIDQIAHHLLFLDNDTPIGTARLFLWQGDWHIGRVCVLPEYRGQKIGAFLVKECIEKAKELGQSHTVSISAQVQAESFYEKLGFQKNGNVYLDEHCPHITMTLSI